MIFAKISSKGQITIPSKIRVFFGVNSNEKVELLVRDSVVVIQPLKSFKSLNGSVKPASGDSRKAMEKAAGE